MTTESVNYQARCETLKHIKEVNRLLLLFSKELMDRACEHDTSKLEEPEASIFEGQTCHLLDTKYNSPEYKDQLEKLGKALAHHYANNRHHPQHQKEGIRGMNLVDLVEMFLDWMAAAKRQMDGNILVSLEENQNKYGYSDDLKQIMKNTANLIESL